MKRLLFSLVVLVCCSCQTYQYAKNVRMVALDESPKQGKGLGKVSGEACTWKILGTWIGKMPTVSDAVEALTQKKDFSYLTNVKTENDGFDFAGIIGNRCIIAKGNAFR